MRITRSKELEEIIDDALQSIAAVKGSKLRDQIAFMMQAGQVMRMIAIACGKLQEEEPEFVSALHRQSAEVFANAATLLSSAWGLTDEDDEEALRWVKTLDDHVERAMAEANK